MESVETAFMCIEMLGGDGENIQIDKSCWRRSFRWEFGHIATEKHYKIKCHVNNFGRLDVTNIYRRRTENSEGILGNMKGILYFDENFILYFDENFNTFGSYSSNSTINFEVGQRINIFEVRLIENSTISK